MSTASSDSDQTKPSFQETAASGMLVTPAAKSTPSLKAQEELTRAIEKLEELTEPVEKSGDAEAQ